MNPSSCAPHKTHLSRLERGVTRLGMIFFGSIVFCVGWVAYNVIPFYYSYYELLGQMDAQAVKASLFTDVQITQELMRWVKKLGIPIDRPDELKINRFEGKIVMEMNYDEVLSADLGEDRIYDLWVFHFNPRVEREY